MESALVASRAITQKEQRRVQPLDSAAAERVVVVAIIEDIEPTPESVRPPNALTPEELPESYNEYRWLAGWKD